MRQTLLALSRLRLPRLPTFPFSTDPGGTGLSPAASRAPQKALLSKAMIDCVLSSKLGDPGTPLHEWRCLGEQMAEAKVEKWYDIEPDEEVRKELVDSVVVGAGVTLVKAVKP